MLESQPQNPEFGSYNSILLNIEIVNFEAYCKF